MDEGFGAGDNNFYDRAQDRLHASSIRRTCPCISQRGSASAFLHCGLVFSEGRIVFDELNDALLFIIKIDGFCFFPRLG